MNYFSLHTLRGSLWVRQIFSLAVLLFFVGGILYLTQEKSNYAAGLTQDTTANEAYWRGQIQQRGGSDAYKEFSSAVADKTASQRHQFAHAFGGALYEVNGIPGLAVCDTQFSFGCFHEFLGRAIAQNGLSVVDSLNAACADRLAGTALSCQHGIGHGIAAYIGYTKKDLDKELAVCKDLPFSDPIGGCYSGVFMEYNLRTMLGADARLRPVENEDIFAPCDTLPSTYKLPCTFWQPQWWQQALYNGSNDPSIFTKIGQHCVDMNSSEDLRKTCFEGLGTVVAADAEYNPSQATLFCDAASTDLRYSLYCKSYAANSIGLENKKVDAREVCAGLADSAREYCTDYAINKANLANERSFPKI